MNHGKPTPLIKGEDELSNCIELLKLKRQEIHDRILEEEEKERMQNEIAILNEKLQRINHSITKKSQARIEYDRTIQETTAAYSKIRESTKSLLHILKREENNLNNKMHNGPSEKEIKSLRELGKLHN